MYLGLIFATDSRAAIALGREGATAVSLPAQPCEAGETTRRRRARWIICLSVHPLPSTGSAPPLAPGNAAHGCDTGVAGKWAAAGLEGVQTPAREPVSFERRSSQEAVASALRVPTRFALRSGFLHLQERGCGSVGKPKPGVG